MTHSLYLWISDDTVNKFAHYTVLWVNYRRRDCMKCNFSPLLSAMHFPHIDGIVSYTHIDMKTAAHILKLLNFVLWQQQSEISRDRRGHNDDRLCVPLFKMKNDCVLFSPSSHYYTPLHSIDGRLLYFQVSYLMNSQFIHLQPEKGRKKGGDWAVENQQRGNQK